MPSQTTPVKIKLHASGRPRPLKLTRTRTTRHGITAYKGSIILSGYIDTHPDHGYTLERLMQEVGWIESEARWRDEPLEELELIINSPGGDLYEGLGMYDYIKSLPCKTVSKVFGHCGSAGTLPQLACRERHISASAFYYIHFPQGATAGSPDEVRDYLEQMDRATEKMVAIYAAETGQGENDIRSLLDPEQWLDAHQAVALGFCHTVDPQPATQTSTTDPTNQPTPTMTTQNKRPRASSPFTRLAAKLGINLRAQTDDTEDLDKDKDKEQNPTATTEQIPPDDIPPAETQDEDPVFDENGNALPTAQTSDRNDEEDQEDTEITAAIATRFYALQQENASLRRQLKAKGRSPAPQATAAAVIQGLAALGVHPSGLPAQAQAPTASGTPVQRLQAATTPEQRAQAAADLLAARRKK